MPRRAQSVPKVNSEVSPPPAYVGLSSNPDYQDLGRIIDGDFFDTGALSQNGDSLGETATLPSAVPEEPVDLNQVFRVRSVRAGAGRVSTIPEDLPRHDSSPSAADSVVGMPSCNSLSVEQSVSEHWTPSKRRLDDAFEQLSPQAVMAGKSVSSISSRSSSGGRPKDHLAMSHVVSQSMGLTWTRSKVVMADWFMLDGSAALEARARRRVIKPGAGAPFDLGSNQRLGMSGFKTWMSGFKHGHEQTSALGGSKFGQSSELYASPLGISASTAGLGNMTASPGLESSIEVAEELKYFVKHPPYFMVAQLVLVSLLFVECQLQLLGSSDEGESALVSALKLMIQRDCVDERSEVWRWLTYQFLHLSAWHIIFNAFVFLVFGFPLERFYGTPLIVLMYNVGVLGGTFCYFVSDPHIEAVGMSGGCCALHSLHLAKLFMNWHGTEYRVEKLVFLVFLLLGQTIYALLTWNSGSSHSIHFGGYVAGLCIGIVLGSSKFTASTALRLKAVVCLIGCSLAIWCLWWLATMWPPADMWEQVKWCWHRQVSNATLFGDSRYRCVRCPNSTCIEQWQMQSSLLQVSSRSCYDIGWSGR